MSALRRAIEAVQTVDRRKGDALDVGDEGARDIVRGVLMAVRAEAHGVAAEVYGEQCVEKEVDDFNAMIDAILGEWAVAQSHDGKSLGQIAYEGWAGGLPGCEWANQTATQMQAWDRAARAVAAHHSRNLPA